MATKNYSLEETAEALKKAAETSIANAAKELGISRTTLMSWKKQAENALKDAGDAVEETVSKAKDIAEKAGKKVKAAAEKVEADVKAAVEQKPANEVIIQSPLGGNITPAEVLAKTGPVDKVYIRVDENKAYWVRGEESGSVDLW